MQTTADLPTTQREIAAALRGLPPESISRVRDRLARERALTVCNVWRCSGEVNHGHMGNSVLAD